MTTFYPYTREWGFVTLGLVDNPYPYTQITRTRDTGTGLLGLGYGLAENTPGLPVVIPSYDPSRAVNKAKIRDILLP